MRTYAFAIRPRRKLWSASPTNAWCEISSKKAGSVDIDPGQPGTIERAWDLCSA
jgi:hypothetical protein